jgi:hypothetical protein
MPPELLNAFPKIIDQVMVMLNVLKEAERAALKKQGKKEIRADSDYNDDDDSEESEFEDDDSDEEDSDGDEEIKEDNGGLGFVEKKDETDMADEEIKEETVIKKKKGGDDLSDDTSDDEDDFGERDEMVRPLVIIIFIVRVPNHIGHD